MTRLIEWFWTCSPIALCFGLIGLALVVRIVVGIIRDK